MKILNAYLESVASTPGSDEISREVVEVPDVLGVPGNKFVRVGKDP